MKRACLLIPLCLLSCRCEGRRGDAPPPVLPPASMQPMSTTRAQVPGASNEEKTMSCPQVLLEVRLGGSAAGAYVPPPDVELDAFESAVGAFLEGDEPKARSDASEAGFEIVHAPEWPDAVVFRESRQRRGGGAYVVRRGSSSRLVVQAPHTFFDEGTLPLGCGLFQHASARALFVNTAHRYKAAPTEGGSADVAHLERSFFQSATLAVVRALPAPVVVQLHGFAREHAAKAVVSSGEPRAGVRHVDRVAQALGSVLGDGVLRFPEDTRELGATTNVQGKAVRAGGGVFLHVEMSSATRALLAADASKRAAAFAALEQAGEIR